MHFLMELTASVTNSEHLEYWAFLIRDMWQKREMEKLTNSGIGGAGEDPKRQAIEINEKINEILAGDIRQDWYTMEELMFKLFVHQDEVKSGKKELTTTSFKG